ncbi:MAG TPA: carboxylesterase family protein [Acidobacteriaceae bacterium]|nr:carboxylesterase family protein [Acidobacteriaceae bacterium]
MASVWCFFLRRSRGVAACLLGFVLLGGRAEAEVQARVQIDQGVLSGAWLGSGGAVFLGIPYAAPPVGRLRWVAPQEPAKWAGVRDAGHYGAACPQLPSSWLPEMLGRKEMETSEDCLYLNVWTPRMKAGARLPVMVWVHGGGNVEGSQEWPPLGPPLAAHGVVVVTINYRLGVLGYLAHPELSAESAEHVSGNYGLLDQMAALRWVKRNITRFGGDRERVTVFGASSGSLDVCDLMASPLAKGLFQRAIMQSGECVDGTSPTLSEQEKSGAGFAAKVAVADGGDSPKVDVIARLRAMPADELVRVADKVGGMDWNPIVDGRVLEAQPEEVFRRGEQVKVPVMVGSNLDEVSIFASPIVGGKSYRPQTVSAYREWLQRKFGDQAEAVFEAYPAKKDDDVPAAFRAMDTDWSFGFGSQLLAREVSASGERAYLYSFTMTGRGPFAPLGAFHSLESMYLSKHFWTDWVSGAEDERLSEAMIQYWTSFAANGRPSGAGLPVWPEYRPEKPEAQELGRHVGPVDVPRADAMTAFEKVLEEKVKGQAK